MTKKDLLALLSLIEDDCEIVMAEFNNTDGETDFVEFDNEVWVGPKDSMIYDYEQDFEEHNNQYEARYQLVKDFKRVLVLKRK